MTYGSAGNINWAFGDGGDVEDLSELASRYGYSLNDDGKWREVDDEPGLSDEEMWQYVWDRRESDAEDMALL
jgi:hypothetical protein